MVQVKNRSVHMYYCNYFRSEDPDEFDALDNNYKQQTTYMPFYCPYYRQFSMQTPIPSIDYLRQVDEEGTPGQKPLNFVGAYLTEISNNTSTTGANITTTSVPVKPLIKVVFDKDIVADNVWANNQKAVTMQNIAGANVPVQVSRIPDTVNFNERRNIFVTPLSNLLPGERYKIIVSPTLMAKNAYSTLGMTTNNQPVVVNFTTVGVPVTGTQVIYYVKAGDTLYKIGQIYALTPNDLIIANNLSPTSYLYIGQRLIIPTIVHVVQPGDTLYRIALKYGSTISAISTANNLSPTSVINVGQSLFVPVNLFVYTVKAGDTLWSIAQRYTTTIGNLARLNNLDVNKPLYIGQKLKINY